LCVLKLTNIAANRSNITSAAKYLLIGFSFILASSFCTKHPYYIGVTEIAVGSGTEIAISMRLFTSDLEDALRKSSGKQVDILHPVNKNETDSILFQYIRARFSVSLNGKTASLHYIGYEKEEESIWTYLSVHQPKTPALKSLTVSNSVLYDYFPAQTHIIRASLNGESKSVKITNPDAKAVFNF